MPAQARLTRDEALLKGLGYWLLDEGLAQVLACASLSSTGARVPHPLDDRGSKLVTYHPTESATR